MFGAQEEHGSGNLLRRAYAPERNRAEDFLAGLRVIERRPRHVGVNPAGGNAVYIDAVSSQLGGKALGHADDRAFRGGIIAMKGFAALPARGADKDDVPRGRAFPRLRLHLRDGVFGQTEDGVEVDRNSGAPLLAGHFVDGYIFGGPNAVVHDENIDPAELLDGFGD